MKLSIIKEPELVFARGNHICPRAGIAQHDVYDAIFKARREHILVGAVGTAQGIEKLRRWIERCSSIIPPKTDSRQANLFTSFCGFNRDLGFKATLVIEEEITRQLHQSEVKEVNDIESWNERVQAAVDLYYSQTKFLTQNRNVDVVVCVLPDELHEKIAKEERKPVEETTDDQTAEPDLEYNFRRWLKARAMHLGRPLQLVQEATLDGSDSRQDDATKAWNFCTALYYKANQTVPWKLETNPNRPATCFVGIGFYRSRDRKVLNTSLAQMFDELGNSVILRGTPIQIDKKDERPYLTAEQAESLLARALSEYEVALENAPARLVIHKSSKFRADEQKGFKAAAKSRRIRSVDFVTILDTKLRLFREGQYPPWRGTRIEIDEQTNLLYTRGAVEYYRTYTGLYVPQPLEVRIVQSDQSPETLCREILALTKMNWNNTQFDGKYPITLHCARKVGDVMKYLSASDPEPQNRYSYYM